MGQLPRSTVELPSRLTAVGPIRPRNAPFQAAPVRPSAACAHTDSHTSTRGDAGTLHDQPSHWTVGGWGWITALHIGNDALRHTCSRPSSAYGRERSQDRQETGRLALETAPHSAGPVPVSKARRPVSCLVGLAGRFFLSGCLTAVAILFAFACVLGA